MWELFDALIESVPENARVSAVMVGEHWVAVRSLGVGMAMTQRENGGARSQTSDPVGMRARDLACWIKSWNFTEAAIGLAAINSALNAPAMVERRWAFRLEDHPSQGLFDVLAPSLPGRKVAVIGHFSGVERLGEMATLTVLERQPSGEDLPDSACEYVLGAQDLVIITGSTLINKTLPRLLQLSRDARCVVCGPSTPLSPVLFEHGVDVIGGLVVEEEAAAWRAVGEGIKTGLLHAGTRMINLEAPHSRTRGRFRALERQD